MECVRGEGRGLRSQGEDESESEGVWGKEGERITSVEEKINKNKPLKKTQNHSSPGENGHSYNFFKQNLKEIESFSK